MENYSNLKHEFEYKVTIIEELNDHSTMTSNELIGSLQAHEQRLDERSQIKAKEALKSQVSLRREKMSQNNSKSSKKGYN